MFEVVVQLVVVVVVVVAVEPSVFFDPLSFLALPFVHVWALGRTDWFALNFYSVYRGWV